MSWLYFYINWDNRAQILYIDKSNAKSVQISASQLLPKKCNKFVFLFSPKIHTKKRFLVTI